MEPRVILIFILGLFAVGLAPAHAAPSAPQSPRGQEWKELCRGLRSRYPDERRRTIAKVARVATKDALDRVLAALADPEPEPADEAQLVVVELEAVGATRALLGRHGLASKDPVVRLRAAEALGRMGGPVDGRALARALDRRAVDLSCTVLWSMERLASRRALGGDRSKLAARLGPFLARSAPDRVRASALQALVRIEPQAARARAREWLAAADRGSTVQATASALEALVALGAPDAARAVEGRLASQQAIVRAKALELCALGSVRKPTLGVLADRLVCEPRTALREQVLRVLRHLTRLKHGPDPRAWRHTIERLPADWRPLAKDAAPPEAKGGQRTVAALRRLAPRSDRLAILVDFSGSLWNEREDGTCRKDLLDPEMDELLARLDPEGTFLLVPFTGEPHPFEDRPVPATPRNVRAAQRFFERARMRGQGNLFDAIRLALAEPEIDRVMVLTDGAPTGGTRWNVDLMIELIHQRIRFRPVTFDFVLIDTPPGLAKKWRGLAEGSGGRTWIVRT